MIKITILQIQDAKKSLPEEPAHQRNSSKTHIKNMPTLKTTILVCVWVPWQTYAVLQRNTSVFASCLAFILVYIFSRKSWERSMKQRRVHWPRRNAIHTRDGVGFNHYTYFMKQSHIKKVLYTPKCIQNTQKCCRPCALVSWRIHTKKLLAIFLVILRCFRAQRAFSS